MDRSRRVSEKLGDLGPETASLKRRLAAILAEIFARTGTRPFEVEHVELELVAHGDGAFFAPHSDIPVGRGRRSLGGRSRRPGPPGQRGLLFHREPKGFSGGALRLFRFGITDDAPDDRVDVEPVQNSLVVFPSWVAHEVRPVSVPSGRFEDGRLAVNAWLCRRLDSAPASA